MLKRFSIILTICLLTLITDCSLLQAKCRNCSRQRQTASGYGFSYYPTKLEDAVQTMYRLPEVREILKEVNKEGPVGIAFNGSDGFQACWDSYYRTITINPKQNRSKGSFITSILFELHNALSDKRLNQLTRLASRGQISKDSYVEGVERMEHQNAIRTCALLNKGIRLQIFPRDAEWVVFRSFDDHYRIQQMTGHSQFIAKSYDIMNRHRKKDIYRGTMQDFRYLSEQDKLLYSKYLSIKNDLESPNRDEIARASKYLQLEYDKLERCYKDTTGKDCGRWDQRLSLMEKVFEGNPVYEMMIQKSAMITREETKEPKRSAA